MTQTKEALTRIKEDLESRIQSTKKLLDGLTEERDAIQFAIEMIDESKASQTEQTENGQTILPLRKEPQKEEPKKEQTSSQNGMTEYTSKCGLGKRKVRKGTNLDLCLTTLRKKSPHWMSLPGIVEGIVALGLKQRGELCTQMEATVSGEMKKVRDNVYRASDIEFKRESGRVFYRSDANTLSRKLRANTQ